MDEPNGVNLMDFIGYLLINLENTFYSKDLYCRICFEKEKVVNKSVFTRIFNISDNTATGNWLQHAARMYDKHFDDAKEFVQAKQPKLRPWLTKVKSDIPAASQ